MRFSAVAMLLIPCISGALAAPTLKVNVLSATVKDKAISDAEVIFQKNGMTSISAKSNAQGHVSLSNGLGADDPSVLMIIKKTGFSTMVAKCPCDGMTYALSPNMKALDGVRVVLSWGKAPLDVDSHFGYPDNHVNYSAKQGVDANLDVDDTESYGPETITLEKKHDGEEYVYAVHDYSDKEEAGSDILSNGSNAKVFVYIGTTLIKTYYVPRGQTGNLWVVFSIDQGGEFHDINRFTSASDYEEVGVVLKEYITTQADAPVAVAQQDAQVTSKKLNKQGELAYHAKDLEGAISLYQQAIELDGNNGQAYSNLGLAFQKNNQISEAIWANRKAIALATGPTSPTVRASSYYNIARIYESQNQWADAKKNFASAQENRINPVYATAIKRMDDKLKAR